jgi:GTPase SAR1 family protein
MEQDGARDKKNVKKDLKKEQKLNSYIEKLLKDEKKKLQSTVKLLLLGTGESGKSTIGNSFFSFEFKLKFSSETDENNTHEWILERRAERIHSDSLR